MHSLSLSHKVDEPFSTMTAKERQPESYHPAPGEIVSVLGTILYDGLGTAAALRQLTGHSLYSHLDVRVESVPVGPVGLDSVDLFPKVGVDVEVRTAVFVFFHGSDSLLGMEFRREEFNCGFGGLVALWVGEETVSCGEAVLARSTRHLASLTSLLMLGSGMNIFGPRPHNEYVNSDVCQSMCHHGVTGR